MKALMTTGDAARYLGLSRSYVIDLANEGKLKPFNMLPTGRVFRGRDVRKFKRRRAAALMARRVA